VLCSELEARACCDSSSYLTTHDPPGALPQNRPPKVDASCGTGLFTRLFAQSGRFAGVVALDYSETMLQQAQAYFRDDPVLAMPGCVWMRGFGWGVGGGAVGARERGINCGGAALQFGFAWSACLCTPQPHLPTPSTRPIPSTQLLPHRLRARRHRAPAVRHRQRGCHPRGRRHPLLAQPAGGAGRDLARAQAGGRLCRVDVSDGVCAAGRDSGR